MLEWLQGLQGGAATFVGALTGSAIGFIALVAGALFNASLNRRRDDNLRRTETRGIAAAIRAELAGIETSLTANATNLRKNLLTPTEELGLLGDPALITEIVSVYITIDQYCESLLMAGGQLDARMPQHRRVVMMPHHRTEFVAGLSAEMAKRVLSAMRLLDQFLD